LPTFSLLYMVEVILSQGKLKKKKKNRAEEWITQKKEWSTIILN
jgi:hypothetical protein